MQLKLFVIYDKISKSYELAGVAPNHQMFIRENVPYLVKLRPLSDLQLYEAGTFFTEDGKFLNYLKENYILVDWSDYNFPETRAEALAPLNLQSSQESRAKFENVLKEQFEQEKK